MICECCGQTIRAKASKSAKKSFVGYDDFVPAYNAARAAAAADVGSNWHLFPECYQWGRVPSAWAKCHVYGRVSSAPRDMRLPNARYWPSGQLPVGPEYAPATRGNPVALRAQLAAICARHRELFDASKRWSWDYIGANCNARRGSAAILAHASGLRRDATRVARALRLAEAA